MFRHRSVFNISVVAFNVEYVETVKGSQEFSLCNLLQKIKNVHQLEDERLEWNELSKLRKSTNEKTPSVQLPET